MFFSENIYFLILFTLPAALNVIFNSHIRRTPVIKEDKSVELAECVVFCLVVFLVNILVIRDEVILFSQYVMLEGEALETFIKTTNFDYVDFMIKYFVLNMLSSVGVMLIWYSLGQWLFRKIVNVVNKLTDSPEEFKYSDVWCNLFETDKLVDLDNCIVKIERSGNLVTAGIIRLYSAPNKTNKEILLYNTDLIKQEFEDDEKRKLKKRMFVQAKYEYYDIQNDLLIKFYDSKKYDKKYANEE